MKDNEQIVDTKVIGTISDHLYEGVSAIIDNARRLVSVYVNAHASMTFWNVGKYIIDDMEYRTYSAYGKKILATLSQRLTARYGRGYTYSALTRMMKVARLYSDSEMFAMLSQTLSWSHFLELITIEDETKRLFYQQMSIGDHWSVQQLRDKQDEMAYERSLIAAKPDDEKVKKLENITVQQTEPDVVLKSSYVLNFLGLNDYYTEKELENAIASQLENFILELGQGFAFLERQKRFTIDGTDYYLDLLFYHRKLKCLVAIDLKLGKFKPQYKGQMELYLKYMQKYEMQPDENPPIGLLLCSEGNTEHVELMMLDEDRIKVAQYLTCLPDKQWFVDKLNRSILIAKEYSNNEHQKD
jgi:predicted nuclease of restriction endonuclease-like (RecB) superfamily